MRSLLCYSLLILGLVLCFDYATADSNPKKLRYIHNGETMVMLSMSAEFKVLDSGGSVMEHLKYENTDSEASGNITNPTVENPYTIINFIVFWNNSLEYQFILTFNSTSEKWIWQNATFVISRDSYTIVPLKKMINSFGDNQLSAKRNNSYVCMSPLDYTSDVISNIKVSIVWSRFHVEVMPLNNTVFGISGDPCTVDIDDKIVPIAVGGALGVLLLLVVIIYVISYIRDRRQQSKELRSGYNRIDQPEPNHHS